VGLEPEGGGAAGARSGPPMVNRLLRRESPCGQTVNRKGCRVVHQEALRRENWIQGKKKDQEGVQGTSQVRSKDTKNYKKEEHISTGEGNRTRKREAKKGKKGRKVLEKGKLKS